MFKRKDTPSPGLSGHQVASQHYVNGNPMEPPFHERMQYALFAMGCFWGAERKFWEMDGVHSTQVGYSGGSVANPSYRDVCSGKTGHAEVVRVVFDPEIVSYSNLLTTFWESHDPTQGMRQGNDIGTQYRSGIYTYSDEQHQQAMESKHEYQQKLQAVGYPEITTEIQPTEVFFYAEDYHQQYLAKNPGGYCGLGGTGVCYS